MPLGSINSGSGTSYTDEQAQDAVGAMLDSTLEYDDATPVLRRAALTGDVTASAGNNATTIANDAVTNAKAANMAQSTIKGRAAGAGTGDPTDLTATQATAILDNMVGDSGAGGTKGLVPAPAAADAAAGKYLKADGTWEVPPAVGVAEGRLTLTSGTPVTTADVLTAGTLYYTPYLGGRIRIYDGTRWKVYTFTERSLALTLTSGKNYDVFIYDNSGTLTLELSSAWTNDTTRADALTTQDGVYVKSGATTRLYLGTIRASAANQTEDSEKKRFVWNAYNRVSKPLFAQMTGTVSYTYTTATVRAVNSNTTVGEGRFEIVCGLSLDMVQARVQDYSSNSSAGVNHWYGIGFDSTSTNSARNVAGQNPVVTQIVPGQMAELMRFPGIGYHFIQWLEWSAATGTTTWYLYSAPDFQLSMRGEYLC